MSTKLVVSMMGYGTVGGGVVSLLRNFPNIQLKKVLVKDVTKPRDVPIPQGCELVTEPGRLLDDPDVNCLIDVMGGTTLAWVLMKEALTKDMHVISANKACLALYMAEIEQLLKQHPNASLNFEAAVCGGIPIIATIRRNNECDVITKVAGILNGTTNFILTKMAKDSTSYSQALSDAQTAGFAEADPAADVLGHDARSKIVLMAKLAFGVTVEDPTTIFCEGITNLTADDFEYAKLTKCTIKLLGVAEICGSDSVNIFVSPTMVPLENPISQIDGAANVVELQSSNLGKTWHVGPGAGRFPTANSIMADLLDLAYRMGDARMFPSLPSHPRECTIDSNPRGCFYIRLVVRDEVGIISKVSALLMKHDISINSILQTPITDPKKVPFAVVTEVCCLTQVKMFCEDLQKKAKTEFSFLAAKPFFLRCLW